MRCLRPSELNSIDIANAIDQQIKDKVSPVNGITATLHSINYSVDDHVSKLSEMIKSNLTKVVIPGIIGQSPTSGGSKMSVQMYYEYNCCKQVRDNYLDSVFGKNVIDFELITLMNTVTRRVNENLHPLKLVDELNTLYNDLGYKFNVGYRFIDEEIPNRLSMTSKMNQTLHITKCSPIFLVDDDAFTPRLTPRNTNKCDICMSNQKDTALNCGHVYCASCLERSIHNCPACRKHITSKMRIYV
jgi:hypothetical protein